MPASDFHDLEIGDTFRIANEDVYGEITEIFQDDSGDNASAILRNYDGAWISVNLSNCKRCEDRLH